MLSSILSILLASTLVFAEETASPEEQVLSEPTQNHEAFRRKDPTWQERRLERQEQRKKRKEIQKTKLHHWKNSEHKRQDILSDEPKAETEASPDDLSKKISRQENVSEKVPEMDTEPEVKVHDYQKATPTSSNVQIFRPPQ